jgi:hypothetical protein
MALLTLRRTPLDTSPAFAHLEDWQVLEDGKPVGRIGSAPRSRRSGQPHWEA